MLRRFLTLAFVASIALTAACAAPEDEAIDAADSALTVTGIDGLGAINPKPGQVMSGEVKSDTTHGAKYVAYTFRAGGGDIIAGDVSIPGGRAVALLTDAADTVIAQAEAAAPSGTAHVTFTMRAGASRPMKLVLKEKTDATSAFTAQLGILWGACNPSLEPWYTYTSRDVRECFGLPLTCDSPERNFRNGCGCGCERAT